MTKLVVAQDIIDLAGRVMADRRPIPVTLTPDERKAMGVALNMVADERQAEFPKYARELRKLAKDRRVAYIIEDLWSMITAVQSVHGRMTGPTRTFAIQAAWKLSDLIGTRNPGLGADIEAAWGELA